MASNLVPLPESYFDDSCCDRKEVTAIVDGSLQSNSSSSCDGNGKGSWKHAAFHVATTIATPAAYAPLPFAVSSLGWPLGVISLVGATLTTWYSSILIASLWKWDGKKHTTYRHLARSIYGLSLCTDHVGVQGHWGYWSIAFFQQVASLGNNIAIQIAAGSSIKAVYKYFHKDGSLTLQHFIIFFGIFELVLSQLPNIHSLRWLNAVCTLSTIGFAGTTIGVTIYNGKNIDRRSISYSLHGSSSSKMFKAFNGLGVIAFSFGDAMLPEIQSTVRDPVKKTMYKGIAAAYTVILLSYWQLAFFGYWAFGTGVQPFILASLKTPEWTIIMANIFSVIQICGCYQIYCRPTYALFEEKMTPSKQIPVRYHLLRLAFTSMYMGLITVVAAAMPFFGDFVSICGAIGFTPLDFVFPVLAHLKAGKMPKYSSPIVILNIVIATWFSAVAVMGCIGAVKFIIDDIKTYKFFYDMIQIPTKISYPLAGTKISLVCHKADTHEESYRVDGVSDAKGKYKLEAVGDHAEEICEIVVSESPDPNCPELMDDENHVKISLTNKHGLKGKGRYANPLGFMATDADPRCKEALDELGFTGI